MEYARIHANLAKIAIILSAIFGLLTVFAGGSVLLDLFGFREKEGHYVLFVVWANFICGFLYLFASYGFLTNKTWTKSILGLCIWILIVAGIGFTGWIINEKVYETKTIFALTFRLLLTIGLWWVARGVARNQLLPERYENRRA